MKKKSAYFRSLVDKYQENCARISELADLCEKESRTRTEAEEAEYRSLVQDNAVLQMRMQAITSAPDEPAARDMAAEIRAAVEHGVQYRSIVPQTTAALADTGIIPVQQQEMLRPVREGLIWDKVGMTVRSGLVGTLRWPKHGKAVAQFADEAEELTDKSIDFSRLEAAPVRMGIAVPVTREELYNSEGVVENVIREEMPKAITDLINTSMFRTSKTYTDTSVTPAATKNYKICGPFAGLTPDTYSGAAPTRAELLKAKAKVAKTGIDFSGACWVMTEATKALLEDTKVDAGSGRFVCEQDRILGYPVFCTSAIGDGYVGFGDWSYQAAGFFGPMELVVDPFTQARRNATDFVLNGHFATATLREDAFVLLKKA